MEDVKDVFYMKRALNRYSDEQVDDALVVLTTPIERQTIKQYLEFQRKREAILYDSQKGTTLGDSNEDCYVGVNDKPFDDTYSGTLILSNRGNKNTIPFCVSCLVLLENGEIEFLECNLPEEEERVLEISERILEQNKKIDEMFPQGNGMNFRYIKVPAELKEPLLFLADGKKLVSEYVFTNKHGKPYSIAELSEEEIEKFRVKKRKRRGENENYKAMVK